MELGVLKAFIHVQVDEKFTGENPAPMSVKKKPEFCSKFKSHFQKLLFVFILN